VSEIEFSDTALASLYNGVSLSSTLLFGCLTANRTLGQGWRARGFGRKSSAFKHRVPKTLSVVLTLEADDEIVGVT
jgi:hypothetical protein